MSCMIGYQNTVMLGCAISRSWLSNVISASNALVTPCPLHSNPRLSYPVSTIGQDWNIMQAMDHKSADKSLVACRWRTRTFFCHSVLSVETNVATCSRTSYNTTFALAVILSPCFLSEEH